MSGGWPHGEAVGLIWTGAFALMLLISSAGRLLRDRRERKAKR